MRRFLRTDIAPILRPSHRVLYLGDYDLSGNSIEQNARRVLVRLAGELQWKRLALTQAQVEEYSLPTLVKHDRRFKDGGTHEAVETDALSQAIIVDILRTRLDELLPYPWQTWSSAKTGNAALCKFTYAVTRESKTRGRVTPRSAQHHTRI